MKHFTIYCAKSLTDYVVIKDMKTYFGRNFIWIRDRVLVYWQPN